MIYTLMNKDRPLIDFHWDMIFGSHTTVVIDKVYEKPWFIRDLKTWLSERSVTKHREHMRTLLATIGLSDTKSIIDFSKALSLTDTLWVNVDDKYDWASVNLFDNEFDEVIEKIAFDGGMYGRQFSKTSPEFGTNGAYAKCWHREPDGIYLYKQGSAGFANSGYEVYSEMYASDVLDQLGYAHAQYNVIEYRGRLVSRCKLFTSQQEMLLPIVAFLGDTGVDFTDVIDFCNKQNLIQSLAEYLITDALILNEDRHLGNIGVICDANTFEIKRLSPIYDNGVSLCCLYRSRLEDCDMLEYAQFRTPVLYSNFIQEAVYFASREQISKLKPLLEFKFKVDSPYSLDKTEPGRVAQLEQLIRNQVQKLVNLNQRRGTERTSVFGE